MGKLSHDQHRENLRRRYRAYAAARAALSNAQNDFYHGRPTAADADLARRVALDVEADARIVLLMALDDAYQGGFLG